MRKTAKNKCVGKILQLETGIVIESTASYARRQSFIVQAAVNQDLKSRRESSSRLSGI